MQISQKELEELVYQKLRKLPEAFKKKIENVEFFVEDGTNPNLLGLYTGIPFGKRKNISYSMVMPDKIILYRKPLEAICRTQKELETMVEKILYHEIAHYFGFTEEELHNLNY
jgi:predicted Zn-dependent protease with MMP-like domain